MDKLAKLIQELLRILYCSTEARFAEIFGPEKAERLWFDYRQKYSGNPGRFVVELDLENMKKLVRYAGFPDPVAPGFNPGHILGFGSED